MDGQGPYNDERTALLMKQRKELIALRSRDVGDNMKWVFLADDHQHGGKFFCCDGSNVDCFWRDQI